MRYSDAADQRQRTFYRFIDEPSGDWAAYVGNTKVRAKSVESLDAALSKLLGYKATTIAQVPGLGVGK